MAGGQADPEPGNVQIQYGLYGKLGCEDGLRCGQALCGFKDYSTLTGVHRHLTAALLAEMQDVRVAPRVFENSETEFRYSRCFCQGGVEAPCCHGSRVAKYVLWKAEEKWRAKGWGLSFGGQHDNKHVLRGHDVGRELQVVHRQTDT